VARISIEEITKPILPFILALIIVLLIVTFVPSVSMFIPELLGFVQ
jgi:TRAP-type C4-dicarboxylate transport system permease large subunit